MPAIAHEKRAWTLPIVFLVHLLRLMCDCSSCKHTQANFKQRSVNKAALQNRVQHGLQNPLKKLCKYLSNDPVAELHPAESKPLTVSKLPSLKLIWMYHRHSLSVGSSHTYKCSMGILLDQYFPGWWECSDKSYNLEKLPHLEELGIGRWSLSLNSSCWGD